MKKILVLCAFFALQTSQVQAALQVIPVQPSVSSSIPAASAGTQSSSTFTPAAQPSSIAPVSMKQSQSHGNVTLASENSLSKIPFLGTCVVKGNIEKTSLNFKASPSSSFMKETFALQIPVGWTGVVTETVSVLPVTGSVTGANHWSEDFRRFLEINRLQGYVDVPKKYIYVQKMTLPVHVSAPAPAYKPVHSSVASALRDAETASSVTPLFEQSSSVLSLTAPMIYSYAIRPGLLKGQIEEWCRMANFELIWLSRNDFQIQGSQSFGNDFQKSIVELFDLLYKEGRMSLKAQLFLGNNILRVRQD